MADHNEVVLEAEICAHLHTHGWLYSAKDTGYDRERALFPEDLVAWLEATQQSAYEKALKAAGSQAKFLDVLVSALGKPLEHGGGMLNILRNGVQYIGGGRLKLAQFRPETTLNETTNAEYAAMRVRVMRQVHFSTADQRSLDLVFFVNGLPVATVELKTDFTQSLDEAISQYKKNRSPITNGRAEPLLSFGHRALVHFAVSNDLAAMTTRLEGERTHFLPFNIGHDGGGNPPGANGKSSTAYLWERVWEKHAWLSIIGQLMIVQTKEEWNVSTGTSVRRTSMLFPRFHQWEAVTKIVAAVAEEGVGHRYLIEHSAGSGKTNTIAWTAHRLARLHIADKKVFDSVIVVVDRTVLDGQLQDAIRQIDGKRNIVATISPEDVRKAGAKSKSDLLAQALTNGELIIAVTVQTFPHALEAIRANSGLKGKRFAVIADEAHSSQSGQISSKLKQVLTTDEIQEIADGGEVDVETILAAEMAERAESPNISYLAFTATPKAKTLELFGRKGPDGKPVEFHLYSMKQAIEEGYILDVLKGYQTYETALKIADKVTGDGKDGYEVDEAAARRGLMKWVQLHPTNISQKVQIIVEHFHVNVADLLDGKAKAMVVTGSRKAAVKYKKAIDAYIAKRAAADDSYDYRTLVAFSGAVTMAEDEEWVADWGPTPTKDDDFTEPNMNPGAGSDLAAAFAGATYTIMLVANKFQTGFDQPLLSAMYVDKKLSGVAAVQTLSRLNRTHRTESGEQKRKTFVLDFVNKPEDIRTSFEPYFTNAALETETDPYVVIHLSNKLAQLDIYSEDEVREVATLWLTRKGNNALSAAISPAQHDFRRRYARAIEETDRVTLTTLDMFRKDVSTFVRLYDFMSQIVNYGDTYLEALSIFLRLLEKVIAETAWAAEVDLSDVVLVGVRHDKVSAVDISLTGDGQLKGINAAGTGTKKEPKYVALQVVIDKMNDLFGAASFTDSQVREFVQGLVQRLLAYPDLVRQTRVNSKRQFMESRDFHAAVNEAVVDNQGAHNTMADYFFSDGPAINAVIAAIADAFYETAIDQPAEA
ncbi:DEAD/DEAH box helicase family protein [Umezawaea sp. Da 62-37]|uniref:type I restriction endonuclease subunit R n=1 Tax=Umezawaea sp. Da 62-37 TaxID=3075927 RepID=UPI0028F6DDAE|nr:DEAD/DEAH box helicase family protein [Umezawaea sp. Da 62-37]WNV82612.1 DEAD/DEAH box helicase family protein [Umezawaea sp. Da 62-37]